MAEAARGVHVLATPGGTNAVLIHDDAKAWWLLDPGCAMAAYQGQSQSQCLVH